MERAFSLLEVAGNSIARLAFSAGMSPVRFRFVSVRFLCTHLFSTTSPLRFSVRSGSFSEHFYLESITSPVRFTNLTSFFFHKISILRVPKMLSLLKTIPYTECNGCGGL